MRTVSDTVAAVALLIGCAVMVFWIVVGIFAWQAQQPDPKAAVQNIEIRMLRLRRRAIHTPGNEIGAFITYGASHNLFENNIILSDECGGHWDGYPAKRWVKDPCPTTTRTRKTTGGWTVVEPNE
jgi:hypothetical protein